MKQLFTLLTLGLLCGNAAFAAFTPPCTLAIDSPDAFAQWTTANPNGDDYTFEYASDGTTGYALYTQNKNGAANDWLITPAITLAAGKTYKITYSVQNKTTFSSDKQDFTVYAGQSAEVAAQTTKVFSVTGLEKNTVAVEKSANFTATTSGDYYFGLNLTSKSYSGDFAVYSVKVEELVAHPGAAKDLKITAAPEGALKAVLTWTWPTVTDLGGTLTSVSGAYIYRGTTRLFTVNDESKIGTFADPTATPGGFATWTDETLTEAGQYYYKVVPYNADGASTSDPAAAQSPFIGPAKSISNVSNLKATASAEDVRKIELTWDAPIATDGGYLNPALVKYNISRSKDGGTYQDLVKEWSGTLPYIDATLDGLALYTYQVRTVYNGTTGWSAATSNDVVTGGTMALPYTNDFNSSNSLALFKLFTGPDVTRNWGRSSNRLNYWGGTKADAWAVLPVFSLKAGKTYKISYTAWVSKATSPKNLAVAFGSQPTAEAMTNIITSGAVQNTLGGGQQYFFSVPADGDYYIGFHVFGDSNTDDLYVDDITVEESVTAAKPVTEASAAAAPDGALQALLQWTNPRETTAGGALPVVDKVVVSLDGTPVKTIEILEGGAEYEEPIDVAAPGIYTYTITVYLGDIASEPVTVTTPWIGYDTPKAPSTVEAAINGDARVITFSPVTEGIHGGYINEQALTYIISRGDVVLSTEVKSSPYTDEEADLPLAVYTYSVKAVNGDYTGEATVSNKLTIGDALSLPFNQKFDAATDFDLWTLGLGSWKWDNTKKGLQNGKANSWAFTPPITMKKGECKLTFKATCYNSRNEEDIEIRLVKAAEVPLADDVIDLGDYHITSVNYPDATEKTFTVPQTGTYYVAFGQTVNKFYAYLQALDIEQVSEEPDNVGIDSVNVAEEGEARYFTLQGIELKEPVRGQTVIVVRGGKSYKAIYLK